MRNVMEDKYRTLAAQIDNIYRENETVDMNMVAKLIQDTVLPEPYSKYMRAADEAWSWFVNQRSEKFPLEGLAEAIKAEIERPEPLVPGVLYKNTPENRIRINTDYPVIIGKSNERGLAYWLPGVNMWKTKTEIYGKDYPNWFALIPDGEVQDE
jgi:hypothetical protein